MSGQEACPRRKRRRKQRHPTNLLNSTTALVNVLVIVVGSCTSHFVAAWSVSPIHGHMRGRKAFSLDYTPMTSHGKRLGRPTSTLFEQQSRQSSNSAMQRRANSALHMSLIPLSVDEVEQLVAVGGSPTGVQYASYFGRTGRERYARLLESSIVSFLGVFFSYFLSFVLGGFLATIFGCLFLFWGILSPEFKAIQRNWEFYGGRPLVDTTDLDQDDDGWYIGRRTRDPDRAGLYGALFLGRIDDVCVVEDSSSTREYDLSEFSDYEMEKDELEQFTGQPYLLRCRCTDSTNRSLQIHSRLSEEYLTLEPGMSMLAIMLSTSPKFTSLAALTDLYVPEGQCWIGDYPYLDRAEVEALLAQDDEIWDALQVEGRDFLDEVDDTDAEDGEGDNNDLVTEGDSPDDRSLVYRKRKY